MDIIYICMYVYIYMYIYIYVCVLHMNIYIHILHTHIPHTYVYSMHIYILQYIYSIFTTYIDTAYLCKYIYINIQYTHYIFFLSPKCSRQSIKRQLQLYSLTNSSLTYELYTLQPTLQTLNPDQMESQFWTHWDWSESVPIPPNSNRLSNSFIAI